MPAIAPVAVSNARNLQEDSERTARLVCAGEIVQWAPLAPKHFMASDLVARRAAAPMAYKLAEIPVYTANK